MADLELLTLKLAQMTIESTKYQESTKPPLLIASVSGSVCPKCGCTDYEEWEEELEIKIRSEGIRALVHTATEEGAKGTTAARYLADKGWLSKRGRPSKEELAGEKKERTRIMDEITEDAKRLGIH